MQRLQQLVLSNKSKLISEADKAIQHSLKQAYKRNKSGGVPFEPAFVASLIFDGLPNLHARWQPLMPGIELNLAGVFCHQSPKVTWQGIQNLQIPIRNSVELGDLLICHFHENLSGIARNCAVLLQAKMTERVPYRIPKSEMAQLYLYEKYPTFNYTTPPVLQNQTRSVAKNSGRPLKYLLISLKSNPLTAKPNMILVSTSTFDQCLVNLLGHWDGRVFVRTKFPPNDDWSKVVGDLLREISKTLYSLKQRSKLKHKRGQLAINTSLSGLNMNSCYVGSSSFEDINALLSNSFGGSDSGKLNPHHAKKLDSEDGISVLLIHTKEMEH